ncbi:MAG: serine/threonine protein kinase, partial [Planctomycetes bacterium]|nr:serine/threonine protein kinase [Planctomycetota bacterium]
MTREGAKNSPKGGKKPASPSPTPINASPHGNVLGDFELGRVIGRGGMGIVYEAWQRSLERTVAVKVLADHIAASPKSVQRFEREAQAAAKLHHTHIIPIYARGEHNGKYYYAMELIKGPSLYDIITKGRERRDAETDTIDLAETIPLPRAVPPGGSSTADSSGTGSAAQVPLGTSSSSEEAAAPASLAYQFNAIATHIASIADALGYAHAQGVIHRDVKPQNLILGEDGRLRIADFGLARIAHQPGVTVTGEVLGSPLYMSPEQISGEPGKVDHRTDIYSLGATLYEWLTLEPPHPGDTRETVIAKILTEEVAPLRVRNPSVPVDLETLCLKALHHDPSRRFASAGEFRDDLKRFVENRPIRARRAGVLERVRKFVGRHQVATLGTLAAIVALGLGWALLDTRQEVTQQTRAAERSQEDANRLLDLLEYIPVPAAGMMLEGLAGQTWFRA